jgi:RimJ/RimL family protein N-acetyltransferase
MAKIKPIDVNLKDGTSVILRSPGESDAPLFIEYCKHIFSNSDYVITEPDEYHADLSKQKEWIKNFEGKQGSISIIAEYDGKIIGNIDFNNKSHRRRIKHRGDFGMGVIKDFRGKGIGKLLISELIGWARLPNNPVEKIELMVMSENEPAIHLYKSLGFQEEGRVTKEIKMPDGRYIDGISMGLWLE